MYRYPPPWGQMKSESPWVTKDHCFTGCEIGDHKAVWTGFYDVVHPGVKSCLGECLDDS